MTDDMIERVARAICLACGGQPDSVSLDAPQWYCCRSAARAAIKAMREPTDEMLRAASDDALAEDAAGVWRSMIDAALKRDE